MERGDRTLIEPVGNVDLPGTKFDISSGLRKVQQKTGAFVSSERNRVAVGGYIIGTSLDFIPIDTVCTTVFRGCLYRE